MADDLIAFVTARLDEIETLAKATMEHWPFGNVDSAASIPGNGPLYVWAHVTAHDPRRVLREVAAKRAILTLHPAIPMRGIDAASCRQCRLTCPCPTLRQVAAVNSDHVDYREEWKP